MTDILTKINNTKKQEIINYKKQQSLANLQDKIKDSKPTRGFISKIKKNHEEKKISIIAEIKKASPSKGIIKKNFDPISIAKEYTKANATCISILTDEQYFQGHLSYINLVKENTTLPILRKDFIIDEYQIYQSRVYGADAILLIAASLSKMQLEEYENLAHNLDMDVLVEIHNKDELEKISNLNTLLIGINNRNLKTFEVDINNSINLVKHIDQDKIIVAESGIKTNEDIKLFQKYNINTFLIGESIVKNNDIEYTLKQLLKL